MELALQIIIDEWIKEAQQMNAIELGAELQKTSVAYLRAIAASLQLSNCFGVKDRAALELAIHLHYFPGIQL